MSELDYGKWIYLKHFTEIRETIGIKKQDLESCDIEPSNFYRFLKGELNMCSIEKLEILEHYYKNKVNRLNTGYDAFVNEKGKSYNYNAGTNSEFTDFIENNGLGLKTPKK